jgi:hypothetical protein
MRRFVAIFVALNFSWMLILPAFARSSHSDLPPCCRKDGKHQCQMATAKGSAEASFLVIKDKCPCVPHSAFARSVEIFSPLVKPAVVVAADATVKLCTAAQAGCAASHHPANQKRGPPPFLLSSKISS